MNSIFRRAVDVGLIVFGSVVPFFSGTLEGPEHHVFDGSLVAFAAALALSVFPACGIYDSGSRYSPLNLFSRTVLAWIVVQGATTLLLYVLHKAQILSSLWFAYWTVTSGIGLLIFRALTLAIYGKIERVARRRPAVADGRDPAHKRQDTVGAVVNRMIKRGVDILGAAALLILLSPALLGLAWLVRRDGGSAIFGHVRVGRNGRRFKCLKFRSMIPNADVVLKELLARDADARAEWDREFKLKNDIRITSIGHFLRKTSLDELPQLVNVLKGEMSLVGPRPIVEAELTRYGADVGYYLMSSPGMTGLWQVSGRNDTDYATRVALDVAYVKNWSIWRDVSILARTFSVVLRGSGAY
ncbi:sugar transferase [Paraburkholderia sp. EG287B]|uniref:sugar transferase n=1 Tax=Paraburkholderia sp. EG287B TaxID=3237010 RepID=UPI0034D179EE